MAPRDTGDLITRQVAAIIISENTLQRTRVTHSVCTVDGTVHGILVRLRLLQSTDVPVDEQPIVARERESQSEDTYAMNAASLQQRDHTKTFDRGGRCSWRTNESARTAGGR